MTNHEQQCRLDVRRPVTSSDVSDLVALADSARGPVGSQADVRDGERVITYAQWESEEHDRAMLDSPEARVPTDHAATIATDVQPRLFRVRSMHANCATSQGTSGTRETFMAGTERTPEGDRRGRRPDFGRLIRDEVAAPVIHTVPAERDAGRYERPGFIVTPGAVTAGPFIAVLAGFSASFDVKEFRELREERRPGSRARVRRRRRPRRRHQGLNSGDGKAGYVARSATGYGTNALLWGSIRSDRPSGGAARWGHARRSQTRQPMPIGVAAEPLVRSSPSE